MTRTVQPMLTELTAREADALLSRSWIARLAYSWHDRVDIEPIHYVYDAPWIFGRTSVGGKLLMLAHNEWCAVEVDEVKDLFDWESVIVKGPFSAFNSEIGTSDRFDRAITAIRKLVPNALRDGDPTPDRKIVFGIHASEVTGRRMVSHG